MITATVAFILAMLVGAVLTPVVRRTALRLGFVDAGSARKVHQAPVPRLGGVAIVIAFFAPLAALFFVDSEVGRTFWADRELAGALFAGGVAIAALGFVDDVRGCRARTKLLVQLGVGAGMYLAGFRIDAISQPFGAAIQLGALGLPLTMLWIAGVTNATNLIDGLDGLAGGVSFITVATLFILAVVRGDALMVLFMAALGGAIVGFLFYNSNPASIFMGDTGSMFLGFVLATSGIHTASKSTTVVALAVPMLALGIPIADTLIAMARRALRGAPLFSADRGHLHHRLLDKGLSHRAAVLAIYGGAAFFGVAALLVSFSNGPQGTAILVLVSVIAFVVLRALGLANIGMARVALADRRRNLEVRGAVRRAAEELDRARAIAQVWAVVCSMAPTFGASAVALKLGRLKESGHDWEWSFGFDALPSSAFRARFNLVTDHANEDLLELAWTDGREKLHRDTEIAVELLCEHATLAIERLEAQRAVAGGMAKVISMRP